MTSTNLYLYCRQIESDKCDPSLQIKFMKRIIELATVNPDTFGLPMAEGKAQPIEV